MDAEEEDISQPTYEDLAALEEEFDDADTQILRAQYNLQKPLYVKRKELTSKVAHFWPLVFEQAPPEIDQYIQIDDSRIFSESLQDIEVTRQELERDSKTGDPRSVRIAFTFTPNDYFEDTQLTKTFWWRRASDGWTGLVSEPVRIRWKSSKDLSHGLTDMAYNLFEARRKSGNYTNTDLPEYTRMKEEIASWNARNTSFFTWFGWISGRRYVAAEESEKAEAAALANKEKRKLGEHQDHEHVDEDEETGDNDDSEVEVMEDGEGLTLSITDELWPDAIKFFTQVSDEVSETGFEVEEHDSEDDDADEEVDAKKVMEIRGPVDTKHNMDPENGLPPKKRKR